MRTRENFCSAAIGRVLHGRPLRDALGVAGKVHGRPDSIGGRQWPPPRCADGNSRITACALVAGMVSGSAGSGRRAIGLVRLEYGERRWAAMRRMRVWWMAGVGLVVLVWAVIGASGARSGAPVLAGSRAPITPIEHLIVIFQENSSFDRAFATYPNAANPPGQPRFVARLETPSVNGLS